MIRTIRVAGVADFVVLCAMAELNDEAPQTVGNPEVGGAKAARRRERTRKERAIVRVPMVMTASEAAALDDWRYAHRQPNRTAAIKTMMQIAYRQTATAAPAVVDEEKPG